MVDICHTISSFVEAMLGITMICVNNDFVATILEPHRRVNDQSFCATDPKVGMEENYIFLLVGCGHLGNLTRA